MHHIDSNLIIIFAFIIVLGSIKQYFRWKRTQLWHETARIALEKGQPLPKTELDCMLDKGMTRHRPWGAWRDVRRGLVLIAIGAALYIALPQDSATWAAIPGFIGIACLLIGLFSFLQSDRSSDPLDRDPSDKK
ncbi:MAG TPA: hypothetical protein VNW23_03625 [Opitutaceae bacterium]|jgi:hypothetical protein|nr:hypothetical protein [Opitutaceae bacterium]